MSDTINTCGCCEGIQQVTPTAITNRPGLSALVYRAGIHATFLETMLARLSNMSIQLSEFDAILGSQNKAGDPRFPLQGLTTRSLDDPSIAMLDAWAVIADVLTFYQERIANEGYLRTATERRSILELAELIGYKPRPGVAASVFLAYTLEDGQRTTIPQNSRVQSLPGPGQLPQPFETSFDIEARAEWNAIKPRMSVPQYITQIHQTQFPFITDTVAIDTDTDDGAIYLDGTSTRLKANDLLLFVFDNAPGQQIIGHIQKVDPHATEKYTRVTFLPTFTPLVYIRKLLDIIEHYLDFALFGVSPTDPNIVSIAADLKKEQQVLCNKLNLDIAPTLKNESARQIESGEYSNNLFEELRFVGDELRTLIGPSPLGNNYQNIVNNASTAIAVWVGGLIRDLRSWAKTVRPQATLADTVIPIITIDASALVRPLAKLPSLQPVNGIRLQRSATTAFSRKTDIALQLIGTMNQVVGSSIYDALSRANTTAPSPLQDLYSFRVKAVPFGSTAPKQTTSVRGEDIVTITTTTEPGKTPVVTTVKEDHSQVFSTNYNEWHLAYADHIAPQVLYLDAEYNQIVQASWVCIIFEEVADDTPANMTIPSLQIRRVENAETVSRADYGVSAKVTKLTLDSNWFTITEADNPTLGAFRGVTVYAQSEELARAEEPLTEDIQGDKIELDGLYDGLQSGRWVVVSGERTDILNTKGVRASELAMLASVTQDTRPTNTQPPTPQDQPRPSGTVTTASAIAKVPLPPELPPQAQLPGDEIHTTLHFAKPLAYTYKRDTVTVGANVVKATHGETKNEVLGSGDGTTGMQQFTLKQSPVTYVAAATGAGVQSTLHVYVNDIEWHEMDNLDGQSPKGRVFVTQTDDQDKMTITFGNGTHGARLPTGAENVRAAYRVHLGKEGNVDAEQIKLLATRPLGVKGVINPKPATGGADRESRDSARRNAPLAVQALDRVVSVQDYADFARTFAGIAKANVRLLPSGRQQVVHLTIAGQDNIPIDPTSDLYQNLFLALRTLGNPSEPLHIDVCEVKLLVISARIRLLPDYQLEKVVPNVQVTLFNAFGFELRDLGQPIYQSEVLSVIQQVPGVGFVDLDILDAVNQSRLLQALDTIHLQELQDAANGKKSDKTQDLIDLLGLQTRQVVPAKLAQAGRNQSSRFTPAQLVFLTPAIADTLIINELTSPIEPGKQTRKKLRHQLLRTDSSSTRGAIS